MYYCPWSTFISRLLELLGDNWIEKGFVLNNDTEMSHGISVITNGEHSIGNIERIQLSTAGFGSCGLLTFVNNIPVLAVQFPLKFEDRVEALQSVINQIKLHDNKLIVLGDFNDFNDMNIELVKHIEEINYMSMITPNTPTFATFPTDMLPLIMKDHVISWKDAGNDKINALSSLDRVLIPKNTDASVETIISEYLHTNNNELLDKLIENYKCRPSDHAGIIVDLFC